MGTRQFIVNNFNSTYNFFFYLIRLTNDVSFCLLGASAVVLSAKPAQGKKPFTSHDYELAEEDQHELQLHVNRI
jgi:hypothetical protein